MLFRSNLIGDELQSRKVTERLIEIATEGRGAVVGEASRLLEPQEVVEETEGEEEGDQTAADVAEAAPAEPAEVSQEEKLAANVEEPGEESEETVTIREEARDAQ